jgi:hypothetical protein
MHTHFSAVQASTIFLAVLVLGSLWRLIAAHLCASSNSSLSHIGKAMAFQY